MNVPPPHCVLANRLPLFNYLITLLSRQLNANTCAGGLSACRVPGVRSNSLGLGALPVRSALTPTHTHRAPSFSCPGEGNPFPSPKKAAGTIPVFLAKILACVRRPSEKGSQGTATGGPSRLEPPACRVWQDAVHKAHRASADGTTRTELQRHLSPVAECLFCWAIWPSIKIHLIFQKLPDSYTL